jgi:hypothetical protein
VSLWIGIDYQADILQRSATTVAQHVEQHWLDHHGYRTISGALSQYGGRPINPKILRFVLALIFAEDAAFTRTAADVLEEPNSQPPYPEVINLQIVYLGSGHS